MSKSKQPSESHYARLDREITERVRHGVKLVNTLGQLAKAIADAMGAPSNTVHTSAPDGRAGRRVDVGVHSAIIDKKGIASFRFDVNFGSTHVLPSGVYTLKYTSDNAANVLDAGGDFIVTVEFNRAESAASLAARIAKECEKHLP